jgi:hypothetical protein
MLRSSGSAWGLRWWRKNTGHALSQAVCGGGTALWQKREHAGLCMTASMWVGQGDRESQQEVPLPGLSQLLRTGMFGLQVPETSGYSLPPCFPTIDKSDVILSHRILLASGCLASNQALHHLFYSAQPETAGIEEQCPRTISQKEVDAL